MAGVTTKKEEIFTLPEGIVTIKFIKRQRGQIVNERHIAYGGLLDGSGITLTCKQLEKGQFANVLTKVEKEGLEKLLGLGSDGLSIYKKVDNYWAQLSITLTKEDLQLNLQDPHEYIKVKALTAYSDLIAGSLSEYNKNPLLTQKFVIVWPNEESITFNKTVDVQMEAFKQFGKIEDSEDAMKDVLLMYGVRVAGDSSKEWIKSQIGKRVTKNPKDFLSILNDPYYKLKVLLKKAVASNVVKVNGGLYQTLDGLNISSPNISPTLNNALEFLSTNDGQDMRIRLEAEIENI